MQASHWPHSASNWQVLNCWRQLACAQVEQSRGVLPIFPHELKSMHSAPHEAQLQV